MSTQAETLFNNAELSMASYANLNLGSTGTTANKDALTSVDGANMSSKEADEFVLRYTNVVAVANDPTSAFQATVFQAADGSLTVAMRGTAGSSDVSEDLGEVFAHGAAYNQIVDMYNWWMQVSSPSGTQVQQYSVQYGTNPPDNATFLYTKSFDEHHVPTNAYLVLNNTTVAATGECSGATSVDVTGHSLGGHLADAFTALFSDNITINSTTTYNAPGFTDAAASLFTVLGGVMPFAISGSVTRVRGDEALPGGTMGDLISNLHSPVGTDTHIAIEDTGSILHPTGNHSIIPLTDSLAVYNLLGKLDSTITPETYNSIFHSASNVDNTSLESAVNGIQKLFGIVPTNFTTDDRDQLYTAIYGIQGNPEDTSSLFNTLAGHVTVKSSADISSIQAKTDFSAFLSLYDLSPVYLAGGAAALQTANASLYNSWSNGDFSDSYLNDRSEALHTLLGRNATDQHNTSPNSGETVYVDYAANNNTGETFYGSGGNAGTSTGSLSDHAQIQFGSASGETLTGGSKNDHLYGGGGDDTLIAGGGMDDYLNGGAGNDTYIFDATKNFHATIDDADNNGGKIIIGDFDLSAITLKEIIKNPDSVPTATSNGTATYDIPGSDGKISFMYDNATKQAIVSYQNGHITGTVVIKGFDTDPNMFGINLQDADAPATPEQQNAYTVNTGFLGVYDGGDSDPTNDQDIYFSGLQSVRNALLEQTYTNDLTVFTKNVYEQAGYTSESTSINYNAATFNAAHGGSIVFEGSNVNDVLNGKDWGITGEDNRPYWWHSDRTHMGDLLRGLDGNDIITGDGSTTDQSTGDDDILIGGRGSDQLYGGGGNDDLNAMEDVYGQGSTNSAAGRLSSVGLEYDQSTYSSAAQALYSGGIATIESVDEKNYDVHGSTSAARDRKSRAAFDGGDVFINVGATLCGRPPLVALQQAA